MQQTFIANIWKVIKESAKLGREPTAVPQMVVTTHSSHILDAVDFERVRYFQRCHAPGDETSAGIRNVSAVRSLRAFSPEADIVDGEAVSPDGALDFLKRYLRLTHCDLFFADAAILVEGAVEKLLLPMMIEKSAPKLRTSYLTLLEVGGAYAHRFEGLLAFLRIPDLIITDLDSVDPDANANACRADRADARTSNATLKLLLGKNSVAELMGVQAHEKISVEKDRCIVFQFDVLVTDQEHQLVMRPRTLEEAFVYDNFALLREGKIAIGKPVPAELPAAYQAVYDRIHSSTFKKTDFAMSLLAGTADWRTPGYIAEGLSWLETRLHPQLEAAIVQADAGGPAANTLAHAPGDA